MQENKLSLLLSGNIGTRSNSGHLTAKYIKRTNMFSYQIYSFPFAFNWQCHGLVFFYSFLLAQFKSMGVDGA